MALSTGSPLGLASSSSRTSLGSAGTIPPTGRTYRVLKIAPTSFFADYGCHVRILEETRVLQKLGHQVAICTYHTGHDLAGLDIRRAMNTPWQKTVQVGSNLHKLYYDALLALKATQAAFQVRPSVVHAHLHEGALIGYFVSRILRVPLIFDFQGSLTSEMLDHHFLRADSLFFGPLQWLERRINHMADRVVTSSQNAADILVREFGYPQEKVTTLADSVDTEFFLPRSAPAHSLAADGLRERLGIPRDRTVIAYLGLLAEYQGTGKLLEAAAILAQRGLPVHFLIMGFPGEAAYRAQAAALGLSGYVTLPGRIPYQEAPLHLALGDVAVSPKMSETEGNGKLLNYMATGLPTVAFDGPVAREILGDLGIYAPLGDAVGLADALEALVTDPALRERRGIALRARAEEHFSWDAAGRRLVEIYDALTH